MPEIEGTKVWWRPCPAGHGDFNHDGVIDEKDWDLFNQNLEHCYLGRTAGRPECVFMDINNDGKVDITDFTIFTTIFAGRCPICKVDLEGPVTIWSYLPAPPWIGPPLPSILGIKWPWIK